MRTLTHAEIQTTSGGSIESAAGALFLTCSLLYFFPNQEREKMPGEKGTTYTVTSTRPYLDSNNNPVFDDEGYPMMRTVEETYFY